MKHDLHRVVLRFITNREREVWEGGRSEREMEREGEGGREREKGERGR